MHSGEVAGALEQRRGRREKERENPKDPEGREGQGPGWKPRLFTAMPSGCGRAGACSLGVGARRPARCPRPPGHGPGRCAPPHRVLAALAGWLGAPQPGRGAALGRLLAGAGRGGEILGGLGQGRARSFEARCAPEAWVRRGHGGRSGRGWVAAMAGRSRAPGGRSGLLRAAVWLRLRSREEKGRRRKGSFLKAERRGKLKEPRAGCRQEADVS